MPKKDPRVDAYIAEADEFARPILKHIRKLIHQACPEISETIKWNSPFFDYQGLLCGMAAFKAHCSFFFWRDVEVSAWLQKTNTAGAGMAQFGKLASMSDLPSDTTLLACLRGAVEQRNSPKSKVKRARKSAKESAVPADLKKALAGNPKAATTFKNFAPSHRNEYITWITDAKRPETREKRLQTTIEWLAEGKKQNWKYLEGSGGKV